MNPEIPWIIFGSLGMTGVIGWILRPVLAGLGDRLGSGRVAAPDPEALAELEQVRHRLADVEERLDFAERLLVQGGQPAARLPEELER